MKMKKKGKVYPSPPLPPSSSSSSSSSSSTHSLSVLELLPTTILVLVSVLSIEDKEVLAYLITRGTTISGRGENPDSKKKNTKSSKNHKPPVFDCECFDCYTNYWFRWDSSPNRELIHEIIEAFEEHHLVVTNGENSPSSNLKPKRGKKKEKPSRRVVEVESVTETVVSQVSSPDKSPGRLSEGDVAERETEDEEVIESTVGLPVTGTTGHKGLARKVLPDVLGLLHSNFWRLWNPNA